MAISHTDTGKSLGSGSEREPVTLFDAAQHIGWKTGLMGALALMPDEDFAVPLPDRATLEAMGVGPEDIRCLMVMQAIGQAKNHRTSES